MFQIESKMFWVLEKMKKKNGNKMKRERNSN